MEATPVSTNMLDNVSPPMLLFLTTLIAGVIVLLIRYVINRRSRSSLEQDSSKNPVQSTWIPTAPPLNYIPIAQEPPIYSSTFRNGKRTLLNRRKSRQANPAPAHPWFCGTFRGHTNFISDMSFSSNGKYVASSAEDWSSQLDKENVRQIISLYTNDYWYDTLEKHILSSDDLAKRGFPVERPDHPGCAMIDYTPYPTDSNNSTFCFININILNDSKEEKKKGLDSSNCNSLADSSSEHEQENLAIEKKIKDKMKKFDDNDSNSAKKCDSLSQQRKRECARCHKLFSIDSTGKCLYKQRCIHHWGKLFDGRTNGQMGRKYWTCCRGLEFSTGCETGVHVSVGLTPGLNGPLKGYVRTLSPNRYNNKYRICALDCEMCYTEYGFELTRVTVISLEGKVICNDFVKPNSQILDYNTRFSGITEEHMKQKNTLTLGQVQRKLLTLISAETIVIGHNLASDFRALHIIHKKVVDTTALIPDPRGFPYTLGLKALARRLLQRNIQENTHDSREDAQAALDLALHYISKNRVN